METLKLIKENQELTKKVNELHNEIESSLCKIYENECIIFKECKHEWKPDHTEYERSRDECKMCGLTNNEYLYRSRKMVR